MTSMAWLQLGAITSLGATLAIIVYALGSHEPARSPRTGVRGLKRQRALDAGGSFAALEPLIRNIAGWMAYIPAPNLRRQVERNIVLGGEWLGLNANEFFALSTLSTLFFGAMGIVAANAMELGPIIVVFFAVIGVTFPHIRLIGEIQDRQKAVSRGLPGGIDLAALCMGAGLDFPGAIRQIVDKTTDRTDPLPEELSRILQELDLGHTRRQALENFAHRIPTESVQDFVGAVVQAEEKGNPLAEVLRIQARMLRMRRSVAAEEAAAKAAVMLMGPLMLIFCAIILILLGPFIINGMQSGF